MFDLTHLIVAGLAAYRIAQLFVYDEGPFSVFLNFRVTMGVYDLAQNGQPKTLRGRLFACPYCVGLYAAIACTLLLLLRWPVVDLVVIIFAVAGLQAAIENRTR